MREIKFRVFARKEKIMCKVLSIDVGRCEDGTVLVEYPDKGRSTLSLSFVDLMQYTGLKDKYEKEIYEGDLVEITDYDDDIICKVKFEYGSFMLEKGEYTEYLGEVEERFLEVVGNIYENKELLEAKNEKS